MLLVVVAIYFFLFELLNTLAKQDNKFAMLTNYFDKLHSCKTCLIAWACFERRKNVYKYDALNNLK